MPQGPEPGARHRGDQEDGDGAPALTKTIYGDFPSDFISGPDADGWFTCSSSRDDTFLSLYGAIKVRRLDDVRALVVVETHAGFSNALGGIHGGFLLALVDQVLFVGPGACGYRMFGGATVDVSAQFLAPGRVGIPVEVETEVLRETTRLVFVRGLLRQEGQAKLAFSGTVRKPSV